MIRSLFIIVIFFSLQAQAKNLSCSTSPLTTSYFLHEQDGVHNFALYNHNGLEHAPIMNGILTEYTLGIVHKRIEHLKLMGNPLIASFKAENCVFEAKQLRCFENEPHKVGDLEVAASSFTGHEEIHLTPFGEFKKFVVDFNYRTKNSRTHSIKMDYYFNNCQY